MSNDDCSNPSSASKTPSAGPRAPISWQLMPATRFSDFASEWDELQSASADIPFLESAFLSPLLRVFGNGSELLALGRSPDASLCVATILQPMGKGRWESFQPSQLPLAPWITRHRDGLQFEAASLLRALPGLAVHLGITPVDPRLVNRLPAGSQAECTDYINTPFLDVVGDYAHYWESRGKNLRQNTRKQRNKLEADQISINLECLCDADVVEQAIADFGRLESAGWKASLGTAIESENDQGRFYIEMLRNFCTLGRGRIYRYCFDGKAVAMDLCIDNGAMLVILKTTYDESYKQISPTTLMRQEQFDAIWHEKRFKRIEFYGKTLEWHLRWTDQERTLFHFNHFRWKWFKTVAQWASKRGAVEAESTAVVPG